MQALTDAAKKAAVKDSHASEVSCNPGIARHFTTPGVVVFDMFDWELRTAEIKNAKTGEVHFRAENLEFPKHWSQNATDIVAEKYFRHVEQADGTLKRETSVKQMVSRVVDTLVDWGTKFKHFANTTEANNFRCELTYLLLSQSASFNSPVWFNIGTKCGRLREEQASACFIISVEDNMDSILELAQIEGRLYKGGSGSGVNYSKLRSSREKLSGGGTSCLPSETELYRPLERVKTKGKKKSIITIGDLYKRKLKGRHKIFLRCMDDEGNISKNRVADVVHQGVDEVFEITTSRGYKIKANAKHRFLKNDQSWTSVSSFVVGDSIGVNGAQRAIASCTRCNKIRLLTPDTWKYSSVCEICYNTLRNNPDAILQKHRQVDVCVRCSKRRVVMTSISEYAGMCLSCASSLGVKPERLIEGTDELHQLRSRNSQRQWTIDKRRMFSEKQLGDKNPSWKGDDARETTARDRIRTQHPELWKYSHDINTACYWCGKSGEKEIHHLDHSPYNNDLSNLAAICLPCHHTYHKNYRQNNAEPISRCVVDFDTILSINSVGVVDVFDVVMEAPHHNFIANGFVSHNSGPVPFLAAHDSIAGAIKSGGGCFAPWQLVYTDTGPKKIKDLSDSGKDFIVLSYDPPACRYKAKTARAWHSGYKRVVRVVTDKGEFYPTDDHPMLLSTRTYVRADALLPGMSLFACSVDDPKGYVRVHLRNGNKGKELFHRLVASDVMGQSTDGMSVHHVDGNKHNNSSNNLRIMTQAEHASEHCCDAVSKGEHIFQKQQFSHAGKDNGMHRSGSFWSDTCRADDFRLKQGDILKNSGRASVMQKQASKQKMLNFGFKLINSGYDISTFDKYMHARCQISKKGKSGCPRSKQLFKFNNQFGGYDSFIKELSSLNHRVVCVEEVGFMDVYDIEVDCPTADDKTSQSGHNFVIWPNIDYCGSGIVVSNTRRAAKLSVLNADHGDILEFIECKAKAEKMAHALIDANFDGDFRARFGAYQSVPFQNANHSVRVTDEFMQAVETNADWVLRARDGSDLETVPARKVWDAICDAAWVCGDPGLLFDTTINKMHTIPVSGRINSANPCIEYMSIDDSACNLASLNLRKFQNTDGSLKVPEYLQAIDVLITGMDILVDGASYPTKKIQDNASKFRQLGLGYANLGAYLMAQGLPYDSDTSRIQAGMLTAILTGRAYRRSAELASRIGSFEGFRANSEAMLGVIKQHNTSIHEVVDHYINSGEVQASFALIVLCLIATAKQQWKECSDLGNRYGYRNSQVSVLAPTGSIAFKMDCDTTGVEPDLALVKLKKLVGGGTMRIVNQGVVGALKRLGYADQEIKIIENYMLKHGSVAGSGIQEKHLPVFDSSFPDPVQGRFLRPESHILMMGAIQPFVTGAISKTCNIPSDATREDISKLYMLSWKAGLKAVALYRDGSKKTQPLQNANTKDEITTVITKAQLEIEQLRAQLADLTEKSKLHRRKLPDDRKSIGHKFKIGEHKGYLHAGMYPDGTLGEIFIKMNKEGSTVSGLMDTVATITSMALQYGVSLEVLVKKFKYTSFEPQGWTGHPDIKKASSVVDYIFRWLELNFLSKEKPIDVIELEPSPEVVKVSSGKPIDSSHGQNGNKTHNTGQICPDCGHVTQRAGACSACSFCGWTGGCG